MTMMKNGKRRFKLNKNKKGFSLVELLCAVAIIAIMTPVLINGFTYAAKLNYRSRLQQRVDEAANYVYEGVSSVEYEELADYLSNLNGWESVSGSTGYDFHVTKPYDGLEDCTVTVAVKKYSSAYIVPDLNLVGENSQYLTLSDVIYVDDNFAEQRMMQEIKNSDAIKSKIADKLSYENGMTNIDKNRITIGFPSDVPFDSKKISKTTKLDFDIDSANVIVADYSVTYRYPAESPSDTSSTFSASYSYSYKEDGKWKKINGTIDGLSQVVMNAKDGTVSNPATLTGDNTLSYTDPQNVFVYYTPYSSLDWIDIKNKNSIPFNVFFIEQSETTDSGIRLSSYKHNGEEYDDINGCYVLSRNDADARGVINLFTNNTVICPDGIPDEIYQSGDHKEYMYRIKVSVDYQSNLFAEVSGNFNTGEEILTQD